MMSAVEARAAAIRRAPLAAALLALAAPAGAANKDMERLQVQVATLQVKLSDLQRLAEDNLRELRRLNESLAEQNAVFKKSINDRRIQEEAVLSTLRELGERMSELGERLQTMPVAAAPGPFTAREPGADLAPPAGAVPGPPPAPAAQGPAPLPRELYSQAYADYTRGNYDLAIQEFQEYLRAYPETEYSDNAQYWIGECYYGKQRFREAIEAWDALFRNFPSSDKLPDAHFKKAVALERIGRRPQALIEYRYVAEHYPNSEAGRRAREKLGPQ
ncbi:MAG TPA: tol-pal system protein YbgF [Vicinamibacteria bacterium]|nr:tol-pal system protein YbgF [Vicinamibacteria bacterium]